MRIYEYHILEIPYPLYLVTVCVMCNSSKVISIMSFVESNF